MFSIGFSGSLSNYFQIALPQFGCWEQKCVGYSKLCKFYAQLWHMVHVCRILWRIEIIYYYSYIVFVITEVDNIYFIKLRPAVLREEGEQY